MREERGEVVGERFENAVLSLVSKGMNFDGRYSLVRRCRARLLLLGHRASLASLPRAQTQLVSRHQTPSWWITEETLLHMFPIWMLEVSQSI